VVVFPVPVKRVLGAGVLKNEPGAYLKDVHMRDSARPETEQAKPLPGAGPRTYAL